ncbi:MAG: hypothetical protein ACC613_09155 [Synergistales bacterium]
MEEEGKRFLLGHVSVDSGQLILVDPCYLKDWKDGPFDLNLKADNHYAECCLASLSVKGGGQVFNNLAVCFSTGWGDGVYPVYGIREDGRIVKVEIEMAGEEEAESEEEDLMDPRE